MSTKVCFLGNGETCKTSYLNYLTQGTYPRVHRYTPTLGVEVVPVAGTPYVIWDIAGQERYGGMHDGYYIGSNRVIFFADASNNETVDALEKWLRDYKRVCDQSVSDDMAILLTKCDMAVEEVVHRCKDFAKQHKIRCFQISLVDDTRFRVPSLTQIFA